jgi:hypothetical protein
MSTTNICGFLLLGFCSVAFGHTGAAHQRSSENAPSSSADIVELRVAVERLHEALNAWLRRGVVEQPFVLRQRFEYDGGHRGPMLFIGNINRSWWDYVNGNARATDLVTGICTSVREVGRAVVMMQVNGGRSASAGNQLEFNRALRAKNIEVRFDTEVDANITASVARSELAPAAAWIAPHTASTNDSAPTDLSLSDQASDFAADARSEVAFDVPPATTQSLAEMAGEMKARFDVFKASPSREALDELNSTIHAWRDGAAGVDGAKTSKAGEFVTKLAALLAAKGEAFVRQRSG